MIEKILDRLSAESKKWLDVWNDASFNGIHDNYADGMNDAFDEAIRIVQEESKNGGWIPCSEQMPPKQDVLLLVQCSGKPRKNVVLHNAFELAIFDGTGWYFPMYPVWDDAEVIAWMPLPAIYQKGE